MGKAWRTSRLMNCGAFRRLSTRRAGRVIGGRGLGTEVVHRWHGAQARGGPAQGPREAVAGRGLKDVSRITVNVVAAVLIAATVVACGKKTAPVPPEDVPPSKQERSK